MIFGKAVFGGENVGISTISHFGPATLVPESLAPEVLPKVVSSGAFLSAAHQPITIPAPNPSTCYRAAVLKKLLTEPRGTTPPPPHERISSVSDPFSNVRHVDEQPHNHEGRRQRHREDYDDAPGSED
jgi:hypothetical protein